VLVPRGIGPDHVVETLSGALYDLSLEKPARFSLICFYRGLHCPVCSNYLRELDRLTPVLGARRNHHRDQFGYGGACATNVSKDRRCKPEDWIRS
jgi:hypothetical protein